MRIGSLATGYGGLDMAVENMLGGTVAWTSDIDPGASKIIAHRYPDAPNLGDLTVTDWATVEPIDILTAGYPCQPFSHAGQRKGTADERHIWPYIAHAVGVLRPRLLLLENVAGHLSLGFGDVLGDLAALGYDAQWVSLRAADVGACHGRRRVFIAANPAGIRFPWGRRARSGWDGPAHGGNQPVALLPTPSAMNPNDGEDLATWEARRQRVKAQHKNGNGFGTPLAIAVQLLPTPRASDGEKGGPNQRGSKGDLMLSSAVQLLTTPSAADAHGGHERRGGARGSELLLKGLVKDAERWGDYAAAIARAEAIHGPAPAPTEPGRKGTPRLSARFVEWMMMLPAGHVTDVPGLTRNQQLHALGNGVVPRQAEAALRWLLDASRLAA